MKKKGSLNPLPPPEKFTEELPKKPESKGMLPRLKMHSEPMDDNRNKKEESRRNHQYNHMRPSWWG